MKFLKKQKEGFGIIEVLIAASILIMFLAGGIVLINSSTKGVVASKHRLQATMLAKQSQERARALRDNFYFQSSSPNWGTITSDSELQSTPTYFNKDLVEVATEDLFSRTNTFEDYLISGVSGRKLTTTVSWKDYNQDYSVELVTYLIDWQRINGQIILRPNSDSSPLTWSPTPAGAHYSTVDEVALNGSDYVHVAVQNGEDVYGYENYVGSITSVTQIDVILRYSGQQDNNALIAVNIDMGGWQTAQNFECSWAKGLTWNETKITFTGNWSLANLDNLRTSIKKYSLLGLCDIAQVYVAVSFNFPL